MISLAVTTYNGETYLQELLDSLSSQEIENMEILVCDDCSTDGSWDILKKHAEKDKRFRIYRNEGNLGFVKNFEKVLSLCTGDFIALADQDDIWKENKIKTLIDRMGDRALIHSDADVIDETGNVISASWTDALYKSESPDMQARLLMYNNLTGCTCLINSKIKEKMLPFPEGIPYHDWWMGLISMRNGGIKYIPDVLMSYRIHKNNVIGKNQGRKTDPAGDWRASHQFYKAIAGESVRLKLTEDEIRLCSDLEKFYASRLSGWFSIKAFCLRLKYFSLLQKDASPVARILLLVKSVFGIKSYQVLKKK